MDDRRRFVTGLGLLLASPGVAHPQAAGKVPRVGYLFYASPGPSREIDTFRQGLQLEARQGAGVDHPTVVAGASRSGYWVGVGRRTSRWAGQ